jgi:hypothetical protein
LGEKYEKAEEEKEGDVKEKRRKDGRKGERKRKLKG